MATVAAGVSEEEASTRAGPLGEGSEEEAELAILTRSREVPLKPRVCLPTTLGKLLTLTQRTTDMAFPDSKATGDVDIRACGDGARPSPGQSSTGNVEVTRRRMGEMMVAHVCININIGRKEEEEKQEFRSEAWFQVTQDKSVGAG